MKANLHDRSLNRVVRTPSGCWGWAGCREKKGYGNTGVGLKGRPDRTHRVAYRLFCGPIPPHLHVLHRCDNRACVRPDHLFLGTNLDNVKDMVSKGRQARGERHSRRTRPERVPRRERSGQARLSAAAVRDIRERAAAGVLQKALAKEHGVSRALVCLVVKRRARAHLD
jgi:hypothetical protein